MGKSQNQMVFFCSGTRNDQSQILGHDGPSSDGVRIIIYPDIC